MPLQVLLVQTETQASQTLARFFKERGDSVYQAWDLKQATSLLDQVKPNLLLFDLHFPGDDWLTFLKYANQHLPHLKIIITNKYPDLKREMLAREHRVDAFLRQPFTSRWIEQAVQRTFRKVGQETRPISRQEERNLPQVRMPVRIKITIPYLVLALLFALASAYVISEITLDSIQSRFLNQLAATGKQSADWMVRLENTLLSDLRLYSNTQGIGNSILAQDPESLRQAILPLAINANEEAVEILNTQGTSLLSLHQRQNGNAGDYDYTRGDQTFQSAGFVRQILAGKPDSQGDKFAGVLNAPWGKFFYVGGPIYDDAGNVVGCLLVGRSVQTLVRQISQETVSSATLYDMTGQILASSMFVGSDAQALPLVTVAEVLARQDQNTLTRNITTGSSSFTEALGPWEARNGEDLGVLGSSLSRSSVVETRATTQVQIFILVAVGILLVIAIGLFLASRITRPLVRLAQASSEVASGNLEIKVDSKGNDEVAVLAYSFNYMIAGLQEGSMYRDLLGRTVSPEVRDQLRQTFSTGHLRLEGQEAFASVLMTDIRSFTSMSEQTDPATVLAWLNEYFGRIVPIVTAHGGVVNKFDGDAMLAFFGILPRKLSPKQGAYSAITTALDILKAVDQLNAERIERNEPPLVTGIGINSGVVIAGGLGTTDRLHYTIIGDTVNTTQRLESLTRTLLSGSGILIGNPTYVALDDLTTQFQMQSMGVHAVKGKSEQIAVYRVLPNDIRQTELTL